MNCIYLHNIMINYLIMCYIFLLYKNILKKDIQINKKYASQNIKMNLNAEVYTIKNIVIFLPICV